MVWECKCSLVIFIYNNNHLKAVLATISCLYCFRHKMTFQLQKALCYWLLLLMAYLHSFIIHFYCNSWQLLVVQILTFSATNNWTIILDFHSHQCGQWEALVCCVTAACKGWIIWISTFNLAGVSQDTKFLLWQVWIFLSPCQHSSSS